SGLRYELIFVDDGSTDGTAAALQAIQDADPDHVLVAFLRRNCGQTAALSAALDLARGATLVPMDGDRQNDPADIPRPPAPRHPPAPRPPAPGVRRRLRLAPRPARHVPGGEGPLVGRQPDRGADLGGAAARLRLHDEGLPPQGARRGPTLRRDAPVHPDLRLV